MLAHRAARALVCLRCEVCRHCARLSLPLSAWPRRYYGQAPSPPPTLPRIRKERVPPTVLRRLEGKTMRERSAFLPGITTLGADAEVLVLEPVSDLADADPDAPATPAPAATPPPTVPDLAASLNEEHKAPDPHDISQRIEKLRPQPQSDHNGDDALHIHVDQAKFNRLTTTLTYGFTFAQLSAYYATIKRVKQDRVSRRILNNLKGAEGTTMRPIRRSKWQPGTTSLNERLPGMDVAVRNRRHPVSKPLLVDCILRDCWGLVILEEMEAPGEIELALEPWQLTFITIGSTDSLVDTVGRARHAKMQLHPGHQVLRITADKTSAEYAADDIEQALRNPHFSKLDLRPWQPRLALGTTITRARMISLFTKANLDTISARTRTTIEATTGSFLFIRGYDDASVAEAERALLNLLPLKSDTLTTVDTQRVDAALGSCYLLLAFMDDSVLDQADRNKSYGRNWMPMAPLSSPPPEHTQDPKRQGNAVGHQSVNASTTYASLVDRTVTALKRSVQVKSQHVWTRKKPKKPGEEKKFEYRVGLWPSAPEFQLTAEFGHVLFPFTPTTSTTEGDATVSHTSPPTFVPNFPGLSSLLTSPMITGTDRGYCPSIAYEFIPADSQPGFQPGQVFPELRIQMQSGPADDKPYLQNLTLTFQKRIHNILLPDKAADLRFCSSAHITLPEAYKVLPVKDWIAEVIANLQSGRRLWAPDLTLRIPKWTIPGYPPGAQDFSAVKYILSRIQLRQSVSAVMLDTKMSYTTVQTGKFDAKTGILSAHYNADGDELLQDGEALGAFVRKGLDIADMITSCGAETVSVMKAINPRSEMSTRRFLRQQQNAARETRSDAGEEVDAQLKWRSDEPGNGPGRTRFQELETLL